MARTILEDYFQNTDSHFDIAYQIPRRGREIQRRGNSLVAERGDKPIVIALREISERQSQIEQEMSEQEENQVQAAEATESVEVEATEATEAAESASEATEQSSDS